MIRASRASYRPKPSSWTRPSRASFRPKLSFRAGSEPLDPKTQTIKQFRRALAWARADGIQTLLVKAAPLIDFVEVKKIPRRGLKIIWLVTKDTSLKKIAQRNDKHLLIPNVRMSRESQIQNGLFQALLNEMVKPNERVTCLFGKYELDRFDDFANRQGNEEFSFLTSREINKLREVHSQRTFFRVLNIAFMLASQGKEGKPVATGFVIGNWENAEKLTRAIIHNPLGDTDRKIRNVHNAGYYREIVQLSGIDGAWFINGRTGEILRAGLQLLTPETKEEISLEEASGSGTRHGSMARFTSVTETIALVISESHRTVTGYYQGRRLFVYEPAISDFVPREEKD